MRFEEAQVRDTSFAGKIGYALDTRVQCWLNQCKINAERELVDESLINFDSIINSVITDSFVQELPVCIKKVTSGDEKKETAHTGKKRKRFQDKNTVVSNEKQIEDWILKDSENYKSVFGGENLHKRPIMNGKPVCHLFHTRGYCFSDCRNKETHINSADLPEEIKEKYQKFCNICRKMEKKA